MVNNKKSDFINALTIDVEDYFQVSNFSSIIPYKKWKDYDLRVVENTKKILAILDEYKTKATFFVLGWLAERIPEVVREIYEKGHEIASHGYTHQVLYDVGPYWFRIDVARSKQILEQITGAKVDGYRAPSFSITNKTLWALKILSEEGHKYDSSMFPIQNHDRYGMPEANPFLHQIELGENDRLVEFPLSTTKFLGKRVPIAGGGYLRLLPYAFMKWGIRRINGQGFPAMVYLHPWELDPQQPRIKADWVTSFRHYVNISKTEHKLRRLLHDFKFSTIQTVLSCCNDRRFTSVHNYNPTAKG
jgi:polysaccharide deacetylase family protein (PEP-CTERM system associated)